MRLKRGRSVPPNEHIRVGVVDSYPAILSGLQVSLSAVDPCLEVVRASTTVDGFLSTPSAADVVVLELHLADQSDPTMNVERLIAADHQVLVYAGVQDLPLMRRALSAGALGVVMKDADMGSLAQAIRVVSRGRVLLSLQLASILEWPEVQSPGLSAREAEVLTAYAQGLTAAAVGEQLGLSEGTVRVHLKRLRAKYAKVGRSAGTRVELYHRAVEDGLVEPPGIH